MSVTSSGRSSMSSTIRWHVLMILDDRVRDLLEDGGLTGLRRRDDQTALSHADRRHEIDDAHREVALFVLQVQPMLRIARAQVVERDAVLRLVRIVAVDVLDLEEREIALALLRGPHLAEDRVTGAQVEALDLRGTDVDVVGPVQVVPVLRAQEAVAFGQDLRGRPARAEPRRNRAGSARCGR
jgi:hypothetical protein